MITHITSPPAIVRQNFDQKAAITKLKQLHHDLFAIQKKNVEKAHEAGKVLLSMKSHLSHGEFVKAVDDAGFKNTTAHKYMLLAKFTQCVNLKGLSLSEAYEVAAKAANSGRRPFKPSAHVILIKTQMDKLSMAVSVLTHDIGEFRLVAGGNKELKKKIKQVRVACDRVDEFLEKIAMEPTTKRGA